LNPRDWQEKEVVPTRLELVMWYASV